jgi:3-deoxy-D-manno-octulosonic-acid transferase
MAHNLAHSGAVHAAYRLLSSVASRLPLPVSPLRAARVARRGAGERWRAWARAAGGTGPLVWAHAASVGEQQVLEPVLRRLMRARPGLRIVLSHTSPSVLSTETPPGVCHRDYLPWDRKADVGPALDAARPAVVLFARSDLWPEFVTALVERRIAAAVAGARVRPGSARLGGVARAVFRRMHEGIAWVGAVTAEDAERWERLGVPPGQITITGDPRHDRVLERAADPTVAVTIRAWAGGTPVLIAGGVEPDDDEPLAAALASLGTGAPRTVVVPHHPDTTRVDRVRQRLARHGIAVGIWHGPVRGQPAPTEPVLIVAAHGLLADLYLAGDVAYVGGGFRHGRLHAVAEPAAVGLPVVVGPQWRGAADVADMVASGGALPLTVPVALTALLADLLRDPADRARRGLAARATLHHGASDVTAAATLALLDAAACA